MNKYRLGWNRSLPDPRDRKFGFRPGVGSLGELPPEVDWKSKIPGWPGCYNQMQTSSCVGHALARMFHLRELLQGEAAQKPSPMFIYWNAREMEQGGTVTSDSGAQIRSGLKSLLLDGVCDDSEWTLNASWVNQKPFDRCYDHALKHAGLVYRRVDNTSLLDLLSALALGPVVGGVSVFTSFMNAAKGEVPMPGGDDSFEGGHALCWTGYSQTLQRVTFDNSWGGSWGNNGRGSIPFEYLTDADLADDFWLLQKTT